MFEKVEQEQRHEFSPGASQPTIEVNDSHGGIFGPPPGKRTTAAYGVAPKAWQKKKQTVTTRAEILRARSVAPIVSDGEYDSNEDYGDISDDEEKCSNDDDDQEEQDSGDENQEEDNEDDSGDGCIKEEKYVHNKNSLGAIVSDGECDSNKDYGNTIDDDDDEREQFINLHLSVDHALDILLLPMIVPDSLFLKSILFAKHCNVSLSS
ncbi:hypothetical protein POM88_052371 [Heracleum sosnowskyi]|uniref:Uncharacterized protein n=1 Tax=Heracleum sosnowskyi TaxID=360622 RepID=A0AAD8LXX0_9APIA|nr:hypothetical protein POM88_052371 [Heracleum sosnowskyi]